MKKNQKLPWGGTFQSSPNIKIEKVIKKGKRIDYQYEVTGDWIPCFALDNENFFVEYDKNIEQVPDSVAVIPLIGNLLVLAAICGAKIEVDTIDKEFLEAIPHIMEGYANMYPTISFRYKDMIQYQKVEDNTKENKNNQETLLYFSGGVDAYSSLITHEKEKLSLACIWGADVELENEESWNRVIKNNRATAKLHKLPFLTMKSNLRTFINEGLLSEWTVEQGYDGWWYSFSHSTGMLSLSAPYAYQTFKTVYFGSTYSDKVEKGYALASDPSIDDNIAFCGCHIVHDGFEFSRQDKVARLCKYAKDNQKKIYLRVCYRSEKGDNCCICRKCAFTCMSILIEGYNPKDFGFEQFDEKEFPKQFVASMREVAYDHPFDFIALFTDIQKQFRKKYQLEEVDKVLRVFYLVDVEDLVNFLSVECNMCQQKDINIKMLTEGKNWLEGHSNDQEAYIQELLKQCQDLQNELNKKTHLLKRMMRKVKKLVVKK